MDLFFQWEENHKPAKSGNTRIRLEMDFHNDRQFLQLFDMDVLPGDLSLIDPLLANLHIAILRHKSVDDRVMTHFRLLARVLFTMVIIRMYMNRQPKDDLQIYALALNPSKFDPALYSLDNSLSAARSTHLSRLLTDPEKAAMSCISPKKDSAGTWSRDRNLIGGLAIAQRPGIDHFQHLKQVAERSSRDTISPVMKTLDPQGLDYVFIDSEDPGLTGGPPYTAQSFELEPFDDEDQQMDIQAQPEAAIPGPEPALPQPVQEPKLSALAPRILIEDYMGWKSQKKAVEGEANPGRHIKDNKRPHNTENLRRSKRTKKE